MSDSKAIIERLKLLGESSDFAKELAGKLGSKKSRRKDFRKMRAQMRLTVFADSEAVKLAQKLYFRYVSETDTAGFLLFTFLLDQFMQKERKRVKNPVRLENDDDPEDGDDDPDTLQENFQKIRKAAGNDDDESPEFPSQAALMEFAERSSVFRELFEEEARQKQVKTTNLPKNLKKFLNDIRATDKFRLKPDPKLEAKGVLTLAHDFPAITHRQAYRGLAGMFARTFKTKVKINEDKKSKGSMVFTVGPTSFLVIGGKSGKDKTISISIVQKSK